MRKTLIIVISASFFFFLPCFSFAQADKGVFFKNVMTFFQGTWHGMGSFANGKPIEADVFFAPSLQSNWLIGEHRDVKPNQYHAMTMWSYDSTANEMVGYYFDNFKGHRQFKSAGWQNNALIFLCKQESEKGIFYQRFIYGKRSEQSFKMSFEVSTDSAHWRMVDSLLFIRQSYATGFHF